MHEPQDGFSYAGCTPEEAGLYREVRQLMMEAPEDQQELSSDEEGYVDRLMSGRTSRRNMDSSARGGETGAGPLAARRDSVPASGTSQFQGRLDSVFGGLIAGGALAVKPDVMGRIGPAFSGQSKGLPLGEPKDAAPLDDSDDDLDGAGAGVAAGGGDGDGDGPDPDDEGDEDMFAHDDLEGEQREDGAEEDVREWSRHTATWAQDGGSSDEEVDAMQTEKAAKQTTAASAAPPSSDGFGGMDDLQDLDDGGDDDGDGEATPSALPASSAPTPKRAGGVAAGDGGGSGGGGGTGGGGASGGGCGGASPSGKRSRCTQAAPPSRPGVASDDPFLASLLGKKQHPAAAAALAAPAAPAAPAAAAQRVRTGYTHYSLDDQPDTEATNQQALADVLRMTGAGASAGGAVAARPAPAAPSRALGAGRLMAEVAVGASKPRAPKKVVGRTAAAAVSMPPPPAKAPRVKSMAMAAEEGDEEMID